MDHSSTLTKSTLLNDILKISQSNHAVSKYYSKLIQQNCNLPLVLKRIWESDLRLSFSESEWVKMCQNSKTLSRDLRIRLIQFKIVNRYYWTPTKLHKLGLKNTLNCWKCQKNNGTLFHTLWQCSKILGYWSKIHNCIREITGDRFEFSPRLYVLGDPAIVDGCRNASFTTNSSNDRQPDSAKRMEEL